MCLRIPFLLLLLFFVTSANSQSEEELNQELDKALAVKESGARVDSLEKFIKSILFKNIHIGYKASKKLVVLAKENKNNKALMNAYNWLGLGSYYMGELDTAFMYFDSLTTLALKEKDDVMTLKARGNRGMVYEKKADFLKAFEEYSFANKVAIALNDTGFMASSNGNLGNVCLRLNREEEAIEYLNQSLSFYKHIGNKIGEANQYNSLSQAYEDLNDDKKQKAYLEKAATIYREVGAYIQLSTVLINLADFETQIGNDEKSLQLLEEALAIKRKVNDKSGSLSLLINLAVLHSKYKRFSKAEELLDEALDIATKEGNLYFQSQAMIKKARFYKETGRLNEAYDLLLDYIDINEQILGEKTQLAVSEFKEKYESEKKQLEIDKLNQEKKLDSLTIEKQKANRNLLIGIILFVVIILVVSVYGFIQKRKSNLMLEARNKEVNHQRQLVEEKNKEILDSISYAKRIQAAILPPNKLVKEYLQHSFILYKPKDIVAGDFYWMEHKKDKILFAAADCTGHGVPGAMVSVVCNNGLNRSVREHNLIDPSKILDKTREIVIQEFEKSEDEVKDGMDIALCSLEGNTLQYAGANNPLWIIRNGTNEVEEIKADKQPIGKYAASEPYTTHSVELKKGDTIYIFSDGYADQFGGDKGKKFKAINFKKLLLSIQSENMERQKELINQAFENWKGDLEQIDDVCVIGVRV